MSSPTVILARGLGSRMRRADTRVRLDTEQTRAASEGAKAMMPVGRPLLEYSLTALADAGIREVVLVIGPEHTSVREHFIAHPAHRLQIRFAEQRAPLGTADAVCAAQDAVGDREFLVLNGDTWYPPEAIRAVAAAPAPAFGAFDASALTQLGNIPAERVLAFALCSIDETGALREIVEKPAADHPLARAAERRVSMNLWHLDPAVFEVLSRVQPSVRGELELVDGIRQLLAAGLRVTAVPLALGLLDLSTRGDVASVTARLAAHAVDY